MYIPRLNEEGKMLVQGTGNSTSTLTDNVLTVLSNWLPHWVDVKTPEYKRVKLGLSFKYGKITFCTAAGIIVFIPLFNRLYERYLFDYFNRIVNAVRLPTLTRNNFIVLNFSVIKTIVFWSVVTGVLSFSETQKDWVLIAKRLGRVPTVLLPTVLFLTLRPSPLPRTLYLSLIPVHKWLSRIVVLQSLGHTVIYLFYFNHSHTWFKAVKLANVYGIVAMAAFLVITFTSLPIARRLNYRIFFVNHYLLTWLVVGCIYLHARPGVPYISALNVMILAYQIYYRLAKTKKTKLDVIEISKGLSLVLIPNTALSFKNGTPGSHIRVNEYSDRFIKNLWYKFFMPLQHPYTLTTLPSDNVQKVIIRKSNFQFQKDKLYYVTGPFLPFLNFMKPRYHNNSKSLLFKIKCKRCLVVVGGSAISFALPIMRVLNYNGCSVKIIWVVRDIEDLKVLNYYSNSIINDDSLDIFITGNYSDEAKNAFINSLSEYDQARRAKNLQEQEVILNGDNVEIRSTVADSATTPLLSSDKHSSYNSTLEPTAKKTERAGSNSSVSKKSSFADAFFNRDDDDLENIDVDLNNCDYDLRPQFSGTSNVIDADVSAGIDDELDYDFDERNGPSFSNDNATNSFDYRSIIKLNLGLDVNFGRPRLGGHYYNWCINQTCIGPVLNLERGESICCKDVPQQIGKQERNHAGGSSNNNNEIPEGLLNYKKSNGHLIGADDSDALYLNEHFLKNKQKNQGKINDEVWVIGAGPIGLVNNAQLWANDCGFHFHAESFSL